MAARSMIGCHSLFQRLYTIFTPPPAFFIKSLADPQYTAAMHYITPDICLF
jgi:hypothetical protein